jgi:signal transduction histidine kinase
MTLATSSANLGLWHWKATSNRLWTSDICRRILALGSHTELELLPFLQLMGRQDLANGTTASLGRGEPEPATWETRLVRRGGTERWIRGISLVRFDAGGQPSQMTGALFDITEEKAAQQETAHLREELMHLSRATSLGELSGALAHELNQPLTAIVSNIESLKLLLALSDGPTTELPEILQDIAFDAKRAGLVIQHLRRLFSNRDVQMQSLDLNQVVCEVLELVHSDLVLRHVSLFKRLAGHSPSIQGDRVQLHQLLLNLVSNACDAMEHVKPEDRILVVTTALEGERMAQITITDRGQGIKADLLNQMFRPFVSSKPQGLGLGLSICRSIAERHGGRISAVNGPYGGASFCVTFPVEEEAVVVQRQDSVGLAVSLSNQGVTAN